MAKTISILGITGTQGGSVATFFQSLGWNIKGTTRSLTSSSAQALIAKGITLIEANVDDPSTLLPAFSGAHVIFAVTDFWAPFMAKYGELSQVSDRATGEYALNLEVKRGKGIVDAVAQILEKEGVLERFIWSTLPNFKEVSGGKYTYIYHFDGKAAVSEYLKEQKKLWENSSLLNMAFYASNLKTMGQMVGAVPDESGKIVWMKPGPNDAQHPFVVTDDTGLFVDLLVRSEPKQDLLGVSEFGSYASFMKDFTEVTGVPHQLIEVTVDQVDKAMPGGLAREAAESNATSAEFGWGKHLVLPTTLDPKLKTTSLRKYIESRSQSPVRFANHDDEVLSNEKVSLVEEKKLLGEKYIDDDDSYTDNDSDEDEAELFFSASVVRKFFRQETAVSLERKTGLTSSETPNERVHVLLFQASCEEVLDVEFIPGSHPNVVAPDFPQLCPRSEIPTLKNDMLQRKDLPVADEIKTPESSNTQDKWVFYPHLALLEPKSRKFNFWLQTTTQEFQTRYDEYITRTRDSIEKLDTLIQITRKAPSSSEDAYTREISFWSEIVDTTEGIIKLLYRREFEAVFYAKVCGTVIQQAGPVPNDEDLKQHQIPEGYFSSRWDATKEPICLNGNVFDVHSLGTHFHLWSAYIWGLSSKQAKTARAFKTEMTTFQDAFSETARCLENIYKAGNVYPTDQQELVSLGNGIWKKLKGAIHKLNIIPPGYYEHESPNCRYARAFHDHIGEGDWVELREEMDKFCALVYSELDYEPLEDYETL